MKNLSIFGIILFDTLSCEDPGQENVHEISLLPTLISRDGKTYQESIDAWGELKVTNGDSYIYQTTHTSWSSHGNTTEIRVDDGVVTTRIYQEFKINPSNSDRTITYSYREDGDGVGSNPKGAEPLTIDELYQTCIKDFMTADVETNTVYFQTTTEGLMTLCGFVPEGCADDCYHGIRIYSFAWQR